MHEVSIALGMVEELQRIAEENNAKTITDSLKFAFDAVKLDHPLLSSAEIQINEVPLVYQCCECDRTFEADDIYFPSCGSCKSYNLKIISGEEQHIDNVEVEV